MLVGTCGSWNQFYETFVSPICCRAIEFRKRSIAVGFWFSLSQRLIKPNLQLLRRPPLWLYSGPLVSTNLNALAEFLSHNIYSQSYLQELESFLESWNTCSFTCKNNTQEPRIAEWRTLDLLFLVGHHCALRVHPCLAVANYWGPSSKNGKNEVIFISLRQIRKNFRHKIIDDYEGIFFPQEKR